MRATANVAKLRRRKLHLTMWASSMFNYCSDPCHPLSCSSLSLHLSLLLNLSAGCVNHLHIRSGTWGKGLTRVDGVEGYGSPGRWGSQVVKLSMDYRILSSPWLIWKTGLSDTTRITNTFHFHRESRPSWWSRVWRSDASYTRISSNSLPFNNTSHI